MNIKTVSVTFGGKLNLGNYQSAELSATVGAEIHPSENPDEVARVLFAQARAMVMERAGPLIKDKAALIDGVFTALPASVRAEMEQ